jgi:23S rRNA (uridine2552-2'-O)-methyltransferase
VGAAPGGWSQVISKLVESQADKETVSAVDLVTMVPVPGVKFFHGDIREKDVQEQISKFFEYKKADILCSDAVPDFIG